MEEQLVLRDEFVFVGGGVDDATGASLQCVLELYLISD
jgi:hypothetical protein